MNLRPIWLCVAAFRQLYLNIKFMFQRIFKTRSNIFITIYQTENPICSNIILHNHFFTVNIWNILIFYKYCFVNWSYCWNKTFFFKVLLSLLMKSPVSARMRTGQRIVLSFFCVRCGECNKGVWFYSCSQ